VSVILPLYMPTPEQARSEYFSTLLTDIGRIDHPDIPHYPFYNHEELITVSLVRIAAEHPVLSDFALGIVRKELEAVGAEVDRLPVLQDHTMPPSFVKEEIRQFEHDMVIPLQVTMSNHENDPSYKPVFNSYNFFSKLQYALNDHQGEQFQAWYSQMIRLFSAEVMTPTVNHAIMKNIPDKSYMLHEIRSAYREIAGISPLVFAEQFQLGSEVGEYIADNSIFDKNTGKSVRAVIDKCDDVRVTMDRGDLYRMLRNLLRDAVTHGTGDVITPHVTVTAQSDHAALCVLSPGRISADVLAVIGTKPYSITREPRHGYGKVGAAGLLKAMLRATGFSDERIDELFRHHWSNVTYQDAPYVRWYAPVPIG
jgi:hypothetical protein